MQQQQADPVIPSDVQKDQEQHHKRKVTHFQEDDITLHATMIPLIVVTIGGLIAVGLSIGLLLLFVFIAK